MPSRRRAGRSRASCTSWRWGFEGWLAGLDMRSGRLPAAIVLDEGQCPIDPLERRVILAERDSYGAAVDACEAAADRAATRQCNLDFCTDRFAAPVNEVCTGA